jgi:hypothetical protein
MRHFMAANGTPVEINKEERAKRPDFPESWIGQFSWQDFNATRHIESSECRWEVPKGAVLHEVTYTTFGDTYNDDITVGINANSTPEADIHCTCGQYTDMTLRWNGTMKDALWSLLGFPPSQTEWTL